MAVAVHPTLGGKTGARGPLTAADFAKLIRAKAACSAKSAHIVKAAWDKLQIQENLQPLARKTLIFSSPPV